MPRGMKKIDKLWASTVGTEDFNALLMAFQLHGRLVSLCDVAETSDSSKDSVIIWPCPLEVLQCAD